MAAPTVALDFPRVVRIGNTAMGILSGSVTVTSYDTAHPEVTAITKQFKPGGLLRVFPDAVSTAPRFVTWDSVTKSFKIYTTAGTVPVEVANAVNSGVFGFMAIGQMG